MANSRQGEVTRILQSVEAAGQSADRLLPLVYEELRKLAAAKMSNEAAGQTLQPTALVHEAWLKMVGNDAAIPFANRAHFFAAAAEAMRRILIDRARRKSTHKRGRYPQRVDLDQLEIAAEAEGNVLLLVNEALVRLEQEDAQAAELVKLRFFGGLTLDDAGRVLGISERTAKRNWAYARAWLFEFIRREMEG